MKVKALKTILVLTSLVIMATIAIADPYGPTSVTRENDARADFSGEGAKTVKAQAGNVTELTINTSIITERWQGYYGNITGRITLDDGSGNTMYDWSNGAGFNPIGEIYAANLSVSDWSDVLCVNLTGDGTPGSNGINTTGIETWIGAGSTDSDGIDETFAGINNITVGVTTLNKCPATNTYVSDAAQSTYFNETLLTENTPGTLIFATQVDQNTVGFDGNEWDFQMMVGENGDISETTTYYFYVELV